MPEILTPNQIAAYEDEPAIQRNKVLQAMTALAVPFYGQAKKVCIKSFPSSSGILKGSVLMES